MWFFKRKLKDRVALRKTLARRGYPVPREDDEEFHPYVSSIMTADLFSTLSDEHFHSQEVSDSYGMTVDTTPAFDGGGGESGGGGASGSWDAPADTSSSDVGSSSDSSSSFDSGSSSDSFSN